MHPLADHDSHSVYDAAARLRYAQGVRERVRRTALAPSLALAVLGGVLLAHGVLRTIWPHTAVISVVLLGAVLAVRPVVRWLVARAEERRGLQSSARLRLFCAAAGIAGVAIAVSIGANPVISATAAAAAAAAYLAGFPALGASAVAAGLIGDVMIAHGLSLSTGELIIGAGFVALGALGHVNERHQP